MFNWATFFFVLEVIGLLVGLISGLATIYALVTKQTRYVAILTGSTLVCFVLVALLIALIPSSVPPIIRTTPTPTVGTTSTPTNPPGCPPQCPNTPTPTNPPGCPPQCPPTFTPTPPKPTPTPTPAFTLNDRTNHGNNLANVNSVSPVGTNLPFAQSTYAAHFTAANSSYLVAPNSASLSITGDLTIELWIKFMSLPSNGGVMTFVSKYNDVPDPGSQRSYLFQLVDRTSTDYLLFWPSHDGVNVDDLVTPWTPSPNTWYHIAVAWKASSSTAKFYVNNSQQGPGQVGTVTSLFVSNSSLGIGARRVETTPIQFLDGVVDDVRIWNTLRSQTDIANNMDVELTGSESGLAAYYPFET